MDLLGSLLCYPRAMANTRHGSKHLTRLKTLTAIAVAAGALQAEFVRPETDNANADRAAAWMDRVRQCRLETRTIRADFVQERLHPLGAKTSVMKGTIEAAIGGLFRMTYREPSGRLLVSDGKDLWAYNPEDKSVVRTKSKYSILTRLLEFFVEEGDEPQFTAEYLGGDRAPATGERAVIKLVPIGRDRLVESIVLTVTEHCPAVVRVMVVETSGSITRISFHNTQVNQVIKRGKFVFSRPKGIRLVEP